MTRKELKNKIKEEQKLLAIKIKRGKFLNKPSHRENMTEEEKEFYISIYDGISHFKDWKVGQLSHEYRHKHIIYCQMFNNTPYEKIEHPRVSNKPTPQHLKLYKERWEVILWEAQRDEALHNNT